MRRSLTVLLSILAASCLGEINTQPPTAGGGDSGADAATGADMGSSVADSGDEDDSCGDLLIDPDEQCDGNCPESCDDQNSCTSDTLTGSAATCDAVCSFTDIEACTDDDGCCPNGCDASTDNDCSASCGDGVLDENETCDGDCPDTCDDQDACTTERLTGSAGACNVQCSTTAVTACVDGDGCCPDGCAATTDDDCDPVCGNGVVEGAELCDGNCPSTCNDQDACTSDSLTGTPQACNAACEYAPIVSCVDGDGCCPTGCNALDDDDCSPTCGNQVVEPPETCDGACSDCNDQVACTTDTMSGSAATCDVECSHDPITACIDGDGCCPATCDATNDDDCGAVCGNGVLEGSETCDPPGMCPTCSDGVACTTDVTAGSSATCDVVCSYVPITACVDGDGCCAPGCNANTDDDCAAVCGNNVVENPEICDGNCPAASSCNDQNACTADSYSGSAGTCDAMCSNTPITACVDGDGCCPATCTNAMDDDCPVVIDCTDPQTWPTGWASLEAAIFAETNARRTSAQTCNGTGYPAQPALTLNPKLQEAARCHAFDMASNNFFNHTGSDGSSIGQRATRVGYSGNAIAENIAAGNNTAVAIVNQWMSSSSGHCESIMNPNYEDLGIGYAYDADSTWKHYSVQVFGRD